MVYYRQIPALYCRTILEVSYSKPRLVRFGTPYALIKQYVL